MLLGNKRCSDFIKEKKDFEGKEYPNKCYNCPLRNLDFYGCSSNDETFFQLFEKNKDKYFPSYREVILERLNSEVK